MISREMVAALTAARRRMPDSTWHLLGTELAGWNGGPTQASAQQAVAGLLNQDAAWILSRAFLTSLNASWSEIAAAMTAVAYVVGDGPPLTEIIWTGPAHSRFPVRRLDQVLYDLLSKSSRRIVLVTFAAHRVPHLCQHLVEAIARGVQLTLILESEDESEGQLSWDAITAFRDIPVGSSRIYYWPTARRERNQAGRPGKLHTKCAIVDDLAVIGSANLTDDAFNRNMELGLIVREEATVFTLAEHFAELISRGILVEVKRHPAATHR